MLKFPQTEQDRIQGRRTRQIIRGWCLLSIFLGVFWLPACVVSAHAYFQVPANSSDAEYTLDPAENAVHPDRQYLALYPDLRALVTKGQNPRSFFAPASPNLASALKIPLGRPLITSKDRLATNLELEFKNVLYADIKLERLYQEYTQLRKRSLKIIGGLRQSTPETQASGKQGASIHDQSQILHRWEEHEFHRLATSLLASRRAVINLNNNLDTELNPHSPMGKKIRILQAESQPDSSAPPEVNASGRSRSLSKNYGTPIDPYAPDDQLPWFFQDLLSLVALVASHKLETLLICGSLAAFLAVFTMGRKT